MFNSYVLDPDSTYEEDMQILRVIEAYCTTNKRQTQAQLGKILFIWIESYQTNCCPVFFFSPIAPIVTLGNVSTNYFTQFSRVR